MKQEIHPAAIIGIIAVVVVLAVFLGWRYIHSSGSDAPAKGYADGHKAGAVSNVSNYTPQPTGQPPTAGSQPKPGN